MDELQPLSNTHLKDKKHLYHFKLKVDLTLERLQELDLIPTHMTICSDYPITNETALLMVHAEIFKLSNSDEKYYGEPNLFVGFSSENYALEVSDLENPENYKHLIKVKISRIKESVENSYHVEFKPEAIIQSISISTFDNEEDDLASINYSKPIGIRLSLMESLIKKKLSHEEMAVSDITFKAYLDSFNELKLEPFKYREERKLSNVSIYKELAIEQLFLNQNFIGPIVSEFISSTKEKLTQNLNEKDISGIDSPPFSSIGYPFAEHYVKNISIDSNHKLHVDFL